MRCYRVEVRTTNDVRDTLCNRDAGKYYKCENGVLYVITEDPRIIYNQFQDAVISITDIGVGYIKEESQDV